MEVVDAEFPFAALDRANVGVVETCQMREFLMGYPMPPEQVSYLQAQFATPLQEFGSRRFHRDNAGVLPTLNPRALSCIPMWRSRGPGRSDRLRFSRNA